MNTKTGWCQLRRTPPGVTVDRWAWFAWSQMGLRFNVIRTCHDAEMVLNGIGSPDPPADDSIAGSTGEVGSRTDPTCIRRLDGGFWGLNRPLLFDHSVLRLDFVQKLDKTRKRGELFGPNHHGMSSYDHRAKCNCSHTPAFLNSVPAEDLAEGFDPTCRSHTQSTQVDKNVGASRHGTQRQPRLRRVPPRSQPRCVLSLQPSRVLLLLLVRHLDRSDKPMMFGTDETIERRRGGHISALGVYKDAVRSSESHMVKTSGITGLRGLTVSLPVSRGRVAFTIVSRTIIAWTSARPQSATMPLQCAHNNSVTKNHTSEAAAK